MESIESKVDRLTEEFKEFTSGVRCLFLIQRYKESEETNNSKLIKKITRNTEE